MRMVRGAVCVVLAAALSGCGIGGTWISESAGGKSPTIARASFCCDGTFTAESNYGDKGSKAVSGHYNYNMMTKKLTLDADGAKREYKVVISGNSMDIDDGKGKMKRMQ